MEVEISEPRHLIAKRQSDKRPLPRLEILGAPPPTPNLWILSPIKHILGASCIGERDNWQSRKKEKSMARLLPFVYCFDSSHSSLGLAV